MRSLRSSNSTVACKCRHYDLRLGLGGTCGMRCKSCCGRHTLLLFQFATSSNLAAFCQDASLDMSCGLITVPVAPTRPAVESTKCVESKARKLSIDDSNEATVARPLSLCIACLTALPGVCFPLHTIHEALLPLTTFCCRHVCCTIPESMTSANHITLPGQSQCTTMQKCKSTHLMELEGKC